MILDCAIIGGGPGGLTAGLYTTRGGLRNVVMFDKGMPGGQIMNSSEIENYPGVTGDISGMDLMYPWLEQCSKFGLKYEMANILKITKEGDIFYIHKENGDIEKSYSVIVGTGSSPKLIGFKGEKNFFGKGVSTCATCDGFFYKGKEVAVIGGGDTALEESLYLAKICSKVYLIHRGKTFNAAPNTIKRVRETENIELILNTRAEEVYGNEKTGVNGIKIKNNKEEITDLKVPGVFIFIGNNINNEVLKQSEEKYLCNINGDKQVSVNLKMETSVPGLFAIGDMRAFAPKQVISAAGDGAVAALSAIEYVDKLVNYPTDKQV